MASTRIIALLAKIQPTPGVDSVPVVGTDAIKILKDVTYTSERDYVPLTYATDYMGTDVELVAGERGKLSVKLALASSGTLGTAPNADALYRACGLKKTVTAVTKVEYTDDVDTGFEMVTIYFFYAGKLHKMLDCMGTLKLNADKGTVPTVDMEFTGLYGGITDVTPGTLVFANHVDPVPVNKTNTSIPALHAYGPTMYNLSIDLGNKIVHTNVPGVEDITLTDRDRSGSITIRDVVIATKDFPTIVRNATLGGFSIQHGQVATKICEIACTDVQLKNQKYGDADMNVTSAFDMRISRTAKANAGLKLTFR
jgi:hypothetical protein